MKILLCNAPWYTTDSEENVEKLGCRAGSRWPHMRDYHGSMISRYQPFPFFLATASALLKKSGYNVEIRDSIAIGETYEEYYQFVIDCKPDIVVLEISTPSLSNDLKIAHQIKETTPNLIIIVVGLHSQISEKIFLDQNAEVDFTIYGEYEHPLLLLLETIKHGESLSSVPNLVYRENGEIFKTQREKLLPLTAFPFPDRESLPDTYYDGCGGMLGLELQIHTSRGCPFHCNFCAFPQIIYCGHEYRMRKPQDVIDEMLFHFNRVPYTHFYIDDDTINVNKKHFLEICSLIKKSGLNQYPWGCMGRADLMDDEMLLALKEAGCFSIKYGMESFNQQVLDKSGKALNLDKNIEMIKKTEELGIKVHLTYCLGMLGDTTETVNDTITKSLELRADSRQYSIAMPFIGSEFWLECEKRGVLSTRDYSSFDANHTSVIDRKELPAKELERLKFEADQLNKQQILSMVPSTFRTQDFSKRLENSMVNYKKVLILCTHRPAIIKKFIDIISPFTKQIDVLAENRDLKEFDALSSGQLHSLSSSFNNIIVKDDKIVNKMKKQSYDAVIIPARTFTSKGIENIINFTQNISGKIVIVYNHSKIEVL